MFLYCFFLLILVFHDSVMMCYVVIKLSIFEGKSPAISYCWGVSYCGYPHGMADLSEHILCEKKVPSCRITAVILVNLTLQTVLITFTAVATRSTRIIHDNNPSKQLFGGYFGFPCASCTVNFGLL